MAEDVLVPYPTNNVHVVYLILGCVILVFGLVSLFIKEKLFLSEAFFGKTLLLLNSIYAETHIRTLSLSFFIFFVFCFFFHCVLIPGFYLILFRFFYLLL